MFRRPGKLILGVPLLALVAACPGPQPGRFEALGRELEAKRQVVLRSPLTEETRMTVRNLLTVNEDHWIDGRGRKFLRAELESYHILNALANDPKLQAPDAPRAVIARYGAMLEERGIDFLVVPIPHSIHLYADRLPGREDIDDYVVPDPAWLGEMIRLCSRRVETLDLLPDLIPERDATEHGPLYFVNDAHWTPRGAALAANVVARRIREYDWYRSAPLVEGRDYRREWRPGSRELDAYPGRDFDRLEFQVDCILDQEGEPLHRKDPASPVLILGNSYVRWYEEYGADLLSHLHAETGLSFDAIALLGQGGTRVWQTLKRREDPLAGKRLVIWFVSYSLLRFHRIEYVDLDGL